VYAERIYEILPKEVCAIHQVLVVTFAKEGIMVVILEHRIETHPRSLRDVKAMPKCRETLIPFLEFVGTIQKINFKKEI